MRIKRLWRILTEKNRPQHKIKSLYGETSRRRVNAFKVEKKEIRRPPKDGSEVAWLELAEIRKGLEGTDVW